MEALYGTTFSGIFGYGHITGGYSGSQAEFVRVPFANTNCFKLPDDVPDEKGLYLSDIVVTSHHAAVSAQIEKGDTVGVWGELYDLFHPAIHAQHLVRRRPVVPRRIN